MWLATHLVAGIPLEPQLPPHVGNDDGGTRLVAVPNGNNAEDWAIRRVYFLSASCVIGSQRLNGCG